LHDNSEALEEASLGVMDDLRRHYGTLTIEG